MRSNVFVHFVTTTVVCHISWDLSSGFRTTFSNLSNFLVLRGELRVPGVLQPQNIPTLSVPGQKKAANTQGCDGERGTGQSLEEPLYRGKACQAMTGALTFAGGCRC